MSEIAAVLDGPRHLRLIIASNSSCGFLVRIRGGDSLTSLLSVSIAKYRPASVIITEKTHKWSMLYAGVGVYLLQLGFVVAAENECA